MAAPKSIADAATFMVIGIGMGMCRDLALSCCLVYRDWLEYKDEGDECSV